MQNTEPLGVIMEGIAALFPNKIEIPSSSMIRQPVDFQALDSKVGELKTFTENRFQQMESQLDLADVRVSKLEQLCHQIQSSDHTKKLPAQDGRAQLQTIRGQHFKWSLVSSRQRVGLTR